MIDIALVKRVAKLLEPFGAKLWGDTDWELRMPVNPANGETSETTHAWLARYVMAPSVPTVVVDRRQMREFADFLLERFLEKRADKVIVVRKDGTSQILLTIGEEKLASRKTRTAEEFVEAAMRLCVQVNEGYE